MAELSSDLRPVLAGLRRHRRALLAAVVLGALLGMGSVFLWPPMYTSSSLVLLPAKQASPEQMAELVKTDVRVALSDAVLAPAADSLRPRMSLQELERHVEVTALTPLVLEIEGRADEPARAEAISEAVADADVAYTSRSLSSPSDARIAQLAEREKDLTTTLEEIGKQIEATTARIRGQDTDSAERTPDATALARLTAEQGKLILQLDQLRSETQAALPSGGASVIQEPSPGTRAGLTTRLLGAMLFGGLVAVLLAAGAGALLVRRDPRLYFRDDIADAVGSPVIASVRTTTGRSVADWTALLRDYQPSTVEVWAWRRALRQLGCTDLPLALEDRRRSTQEQPRPITVVTLSGDLQGLAVGPQLAAYATSAGVRTHLVTAQRHETEAAFWAACANLAGDPSGRPGLRIDARLTETPREGLTIVLMVLDRHEPRLLDPPAGSVVILALSAGSATAEELARAAVALDEVGQHISGVVVADPDDLDRTTGRLMHPDRVRQAPLPTRLSGASAPRTARSGDPVTRRGPG